MSKVVSQQIQPEISKWQQKYLEHFDDDLYIACTAISAGKTRILATWLVLQCCQKPGIRGIIIAQNFKALYHKAFTSTTYPVRGTTGLPETEVEFIHVTALLVPQV